MSQECTFSEIPEYTEFEHDGRTFVKLYDDFLNAADKGDGERFSFSPFTKVKLTKLFQCKCGSFCEVGEECFDCET